MRNTRKLRKNVTLGLECLDERVMPVAGVFGGWGDYYSRLVGISLAYPTFGQTAIPPTINNGLQANVVANAFSQGLGTIGTQLQQQVNALNGLSTTLTNQIQSRLQQGLQQIAATYNTQLTNFQNNPTTAPQPNVSAEINNLLNNPTTGILPQLAAQGQQVQALGPNLGAQITGLTSRFAGYGPEFAEALNGVGGVGPASQPLITSLNSLGMQLGPGFTTLGNALNTELTTGGIGSAFTFNPNQPQTSAGFTTALNTALGNFFGNGTAGNNGTFGTAVQTNITEPINTSFAGESGLPGAVQAVQTAFNQSTTGLQTALAGNPALANTGFNTNVATNGGFNFGPSSNLGLTGAGGGAGGAGGGAGGV